MASIAVPLHSFEAVRERAGGSGESDGGGGSRICLARRLERAQRSSPSATSRRLSSLAVAGQLSTRRRSAHGGGDERGVLDVIVRAVSRPGAGVRQAAEMGVGRWRRGGGDGQGFPQRGTGMGPTPARSGH